MDNKYDPIIGSFMETAIGIDDQFLSSSLSAGLQHHIRELDKEGSFSKAGTGNKQVLAMQPETRGDRIYWLDKEHENKFEKEFLTQMDDFINHLNSTCYTGINACEFHYALYDQGSFYRRHTDQFRNDPNRKFSVISYLNNDWIEADGGELWIYEDNNIRKIRPDNRKGVFFRSGDLEHEVTETHRTRMSVTGWLKSV